MEQPNKGQFMKSIKENVELRRPIQKKTNQILQLIVVYNVHIQVPD